MKIEKTDAQLTIPKVNALLQAHQLEMDMGVSTPKVQHTFSATDGDDYLGGLVCHITDQTMHIEMLALAPEARGKSIGTQLVKTCLNFAKEEGVIAVTVSTLEFQAKDFYLGLGFEIFGQLDDVPFKGTRKYFFVKRVN